MYMYSSIRSLGLLKILACKQNSINTHGVTTRRTILNWKVDFRYEFFNFLQKNVDLLQIVDCWGKFTCITPYALSTPQNSRVHLNSKQSQHVDY